RERRDASAALFDADGEMIAQAAHIPVHLGALADAVAAVRHLDHPPEPGELFLLNDPYAGGSHLPDLTLIGAIDIEGQVAGYSVVRAHHSDIGGMTAGSMPAGARELVQEGLVIPPTRFTADLEQLVLANVRTPAMRRGDLAAQRSAVLFVVRTLLPDDVPMNGGVSRAVAVTAPAGCLVAARPPSAVAAGNVETSQRIADTVFRALASAGCQVPAQGQGTMNNVT